MESGHTCGLLSFAHVVTIPYSPRSIRPVSRCTWTLMFECIALSGLRCCRWNESAPPSALHSCMGLGVDLTMEWYCRDLITAESQSWTLYLATPGGYLLRVCLRTLPNLSPVPCCPDIHVFLPPEFRLHIASKIYPPAADKSIWHYRNYLTAASSQMSPNLLELLSPTTGVHLEAISNMSASWQRTDAFSRKPQPCILSSTGWTHYCWPALSMWQITLRRIRFASGWQGVCSRHPPGPTDR